MGFNLGFKGLSIQVLKLYSSLFFIENYCMNENSEMSVWHLLQGTTEQTNVHPKQ